MFRKGQQEGPGTLYKIRFLTDLKTENVGTIYQGKWLDGRKHGKGKYFYDGDRQYYNG